MSPRDGLVLLWQEGLGQAAKQGIHTEKLVGAGCLVAEVLPLSESCSWFWGLVPNTHVKHPQGLRIGHRGRVPVQYAQGPALTKNKETPWATFARYGSSGYNPSRMRQEDYHGFKASLDCIESSRTA